MVYLWLIYGYLWIIYGLSMVNLWLNPSKSFQWADLGPNKSSLKMTAEALYGRLAEIRLEAMIYPTISTRIGQVEI